MKTFYLVPFFFVLAACGGQTEVPVTADSTTVKVDSTVLDSNLVIDFQALNGKFTISQALPFVPDSGWLTSTLMSDTNLLTVEEATFLTYGFVGSDISYEGTRPVEDFIFFDSLHRNGEYDAYMENIDIGQMVRSEAYAIQKVKLNDSTDLMLWAADYSTYEACPYAAGKVLYASIIRNERVTSCTIIGEESGGADAPVWMETAVIPSLQESGYTVARRELHCYGDQDEEGNDITEAEASDFILEIDAKGMWVVTALKQ